MPDKFPVRPSINLPDHVRSFLKLTDLVRQEFSAVFKLDDQQPFMSSKEKDYFVYIN
jgi:hypothetical protein